MNFAFHFFLQAILKEPIVGDKLPIFILKDVDIENLRSLIEYMYKGEVNVQQSMLHYKNGKKILDHKKLYFHFYTHL